MDRHGGHQGACGGTRIYPDRHSAELAPLPKSVASGPVRAPSVSVRKAWAGREYDSLGLNGAFVSVLARMFNAEHWGEALRHLQPDLVIINYGTNGAAMPLLLTSRTQRS
jgi:hypothetical protein